jgi:hypothetical protein
MLKTIWKSLLVSPAILGAVLVVAGNASANENVTPETYTTSFEIAQSQDGELLNQLEQYGNEGGISTQNQVTSVNQLRDVEPTAWAYEALRSLVERYGCIVGYPDRTFRGDRALSRWEFAAGLNACLNVMERLIQEGLAVVREDIEKLKRLMQEFEAELAALGARVDNLEARVSFLEDHQFSTTTKLAGEVIFALSDSWTGNRGGNQQATFQDRVRLEFNTSFTGKDRLVTRLSAGSALPYGYDYRTTATNVDGKDVTVQFNALESSTTFQTFQSAPSTDNSVAVDWLAYYAPIELGKDFVLNTYVAAWGGLWYDFVPTLNPYFEDYDGGNGALSVFASRNPIYQIGGGSGAGASLQVGFLESVLGPSTFSFGYLAPNANSPQSGEGLFNGDYAALAQLNFNIGNSVNFGLTYVNSYHSADSPIFGAGLGFNNVGMVGTPEANLSQTQLLDSYNTGTVDFNTSGADYTNNPGFIDGNTPFNFRQKSANSYGASMAWAINDSISFSAYGMYSSVKLIGRASTDIWSYGAGLAFPDLGKEGNLLGIFAGVQPYIGHIPNSVTVANFKTVNPVHVELFYKYQVTDNISLTPGVMWISKPSQARQVQNEWVGTLRGTFTF